MYSGAAGIDVMTAAKSHLHQVSGHTAPVCTTASLLLSSPLAPKVLDAERVHQCI